MIGAAAVSDVFVEVIDLQVDPVIASAPATGLAEQPDQFTAHTTEQTGLAAGIDRHTASIDHDHPDVTDQRRSEDILGGDGVTVDGFTASHREPGTHRNIQRITRIDIRHVSVGVA